MWYDFQYKNEQYCVEEVPVEEIAATVGTPCYVYSRSALFGDFDAFSEAVANLDPLVCYSVKANSNLAVLHAFAQMGCGFDIVSGGELQRVIKVGGDATKTVFSGVGKTEDEMKAALEADILFFNVESEAELAALDRVARQMGRRARIALRVNPDIDPNTHPYISTGLKKSKFGIPISRARDVYAAARRMEGIEIVGVDAHIGSQIVDLTAFAEAIEKLAALADGLREDGIEVRYIDMGGGLGVAYEEDQDVPHPKEYADLLAKAVEGKPYKVVLEPGRVLVANAGVLVTRVLYVKEGEEGKRFVVVDAGMNDLLRPAFYGAKHQIVPAVENFGDVHAVDVVGPVCETVDVLGKDVELPEVEAGDLLVVLSAGAYGFVMASNYNSRPRPPEVMVDNEKFHVVRERERFEDLVRGEHIPEGL